MVIKKFTSYILNSPYIDNVEVLRVGIRLRNAQMSEKQKHPILFPKYQFVIQLLIGHYHLTHLYARPQLVPFVLREMYWNLSEKIQSCKSEEYALSICVRNHSVSKLLCLSKSKFLLFRAFLHIAVDFADKFYVKVLKIREIDQWNSTYSILLCLFACFCTNVDHLEAVSVLCS